MDTATAHCPHCLLVLPGVAALPYPPEPMRCPFCRLVIGAQRARENGDDGEHGARAHGSAAGVLVNAVRRDGGMVLDEEEVVTALRDVATERGAPLDRLRMLDYQVQAEADEALPGLGAVIATFGSWKAARSAASARVRSA